MNTKDKKKMRKNWYKYHIPGMSGIHRLKKNAIFVSNANTINHELAKCLGAIMVNRFGDLKFTPKIKKCLYEIDKEVRKLGFVKSPSDFVTEAEPNSENRRVDLVELKNNTRYEFETKKRERKENCITIYLGIS